MQKKARLFFPKKICGQSVYQLDVLGTFGASGDSTLAKVTVSGRFTQTARSTTAGGYSKFTDTATGGTGLTGESNTGSAAWRHDRDSFGLWEL